jgi:hypothetical protein
MEWETGRVALSTFLIPINFPHHAQTIFRNTAHLLSLGTKKAPGFLLGALHAGYRFLV